MHNGDDGYQDLNEDYKNSVKDKDNYEITFILDDKTTFKQVYKLFSHLKSLNLDNCRPMQKGKK